MGSVDKAAIVWTMVIVLFGASIAVIGTTIDQTESNQDAMMMDEEMMYDKMMMMEEEMTDMEKMMDADREMMGEEMTDMEKMMDADREMMMLEEEMMMMEKEMMMMEEEMMMMEKETGPVTKSVSIPSGTFVQGCDETNECFIPYTISINAGDRIVWSNDDTAAHTATGGSITSGESGTFNSGLISSGATFEYTFYDAGSFEYFCIVHPWMSGTISVN